MTSGEIWLKSLDLATIATWVMIIGVAVLIYTSRSSSHTSRKQKK